MGILIFCAAFMTLYDKRAPRNFFTVSTPRIEHVNTIKLSGNMNNNKMERMNSEVRDREKVMRSLKITTTPILPGYQPFHNYIRPHMALKGKIPAEKCGIEILGESKWKTLIENAKRSNNV
jgi:putative transposase